MYQINFLLRKCADSIKLGPIFSMRGEKSKFIPLPWKIGEFIVKHITHLDELVAILTNLA
jgi:hypothetical protein